VDWSIAGAGPLLSFNCEDSATATLNDTIAHAVPGQDADRVTKRVVMGHPARVLVDAAADADLLVVGSRGRGGFTGTLLGSVSQHAIAHGACPVVVAREPATAPE
jgi:nucleotide-binding universal stress UspA family protein